MKDKFRTSTFCPSQAIMAASALLLASAVAPEVKGIIFPITTANNTYDPTYGVVTFQYWQSHGYAIGYMDELNGTAIAPRWVLTAWHVINPSAYNKNTFTDAAGTHVIDQKIHLGSSDIGLAHVTTTLAQYSPLYTNQVPTGVVLDLFGQGGNNCGPAYVVGGAVKGYWYGNASGGWTDQALRHGQAFVLLSDGAQLGWDFSNYFYESAITSVGDSGGGIFFAGKVAGVIGSSPLYSLSKPASICNPIWLWDISGVPSCTTTSGVYRSYNREEAIYPYISQIMSIISQP